MSYIIVGHTPNPLPVIMCLTLASPPNLYDVIYEHRAAPNKTFIIKINMLNIIDMFNRLYNLEQAELGVPHSWIQVELD